MALILGWLMVTALSSGAQSYLHADSAFSTAARKDKPLLLLFTGSDWCPNCLRLEKTVLGTEKFEDFAHDHLIILRADFPQRKKLDADLLAQNENLAEKYNPKGLFPTLVLFNPKGDKNVYIDYKNESPDGFIDTLKAKINALNASE